MGVVCYSFRMLTTYAIAHVATPIGFVKVTGTPKGIARVDFAEKVSEESPADFLEGCILQLREYFEGERKKFDFLYLHFAATDFQREVWDALMDIPFGEIVTYGELAARAGHRGASRAVGTAMNVNPIAIIIPCHRVLPADRSIGEYASGAHRKEWLLRHESVQCG